MANNIGSNIYIKLKGPADELIQMLNELEKDNKWEEVVLYDFGYTHYPEKNWIEIRFQTKGLDIRSFSDNLYLSFTNVIEELIYEYADNDDYSFGGKYVYNDLVLTEYELDIEFFDDITYYNDQFEMEDIEEDDYVDEPEIEDYYTQTNVDKLNEVN
ncbi:hypothetical protein ACFLT1_02675 [Bacteroidota bacterium]